MEEAGHTAEAPSPCCGNNEELPGAMPVTTRGRSAAVMARWRRRATRPWYPPPSSTPATFSGGTSGPRPTAGHGTWARFMGHAAQGACPRCNDGRQPPTATCNGRGTAVARGVACRQRRRVLAGAVLRPCTPLTAVVRGIANRQRRRVMVADDDQPTRRRRRRGEAGRLQRRRGGGGGPHGRSALPLLQQLRPALEAATTT